MKLSKETKLGITAVLAILIIYFGIIFLKGLKLSHTDNIYYVRMDNVNGLLVAGDVICNGLKIGTVKSMDYNSEKQEIIVATELDEGFRITAGSHAQIHKDMLGAPKLNIVLGTDASRILATGDTIPGNGGGADVLAAAGEMMPDIQAMIPKIDSLISALNTLANDPALKNSLHNVEGITTELQASSAQLNDLMGSLRSSVPTMISKADQALTDVGKATTQLSEVDIRGIADKADRTLASAESTMKNLDGMTASLNEKLNGTSSTVGRLLNDTTVYVRLDSTLNNASNLLLDLREHPKRYVHFSIFGKKE